MKITLLKSNLSPMDISVGSARTCYAVNLKTPEDITNWSGKGKLLLDLFKSGHHTTLQHYNFTFLMEGISRLSIWRFFHSHRFYNSDQVSQRYTEVKEGSFKDFNNEEIKAYHESLIEKYQELILILEPLYKKSKNKVEVKNATKKAMENARYILPQSINANMYHTINLSTLLRYKIGLKYVVDCKEEVSQIVEYMIKEVEKTYPELKEIINFVSSLDYEEKDIFKEITSDLMSIDFKDKKAILDNACNFKNYSVNFNGDTSGLSALFNSELGLENFTFYLKLSLSADSQNQRHRTAYSIRPELKSIIKKGFYEYYIPSIFRESEEALEIYSEAINESKVMLEKYPELSPYFLLNGFLIPIKENNSALDFIHKSEKRLCLNSQEEITNMTWEMVLELIKNENTKDYGKKLAPPCYHRFEEDINPICPEGSRFCGIKEWQNTKYKN